MFNIGVTYVLFSIFVGFNFTTWKDIVLILFAICVIIAIFYNYDYYYDLLLETNANKMEDNNSSTGKVKRVTLMEIYINNLIEFYKDLTDYK